MKTLKITILLFAATLFFCFATFTDKKLQKSAINALNENYAFVASGDVVLEKDTISVQSFLMFKTEVSNFEYQLFLNDLLKNGELEKYAIAKVDSAKWSSNNSMNSKYQEFYHTHPAYRDYPVVNVSKDGAALYCEWVSEKINGSIEGDKKLKFRLPTHAEWVKAAKGELELNTYPWGGPYLRNSKGAILCNFLALDATSITRDSLGKFQVHPTPFFSKSEYIYSDVTAPVKSYWPNGFGLYNMSGNVSEMIADKEIVAGGSWQDPGYDVRIFSQKPYVGASKNVGFRIVATVVPSEHEWLKIPKKKKS